MIERPLGERIQRSARAFASLPAAGGLVLILAALAALGIANSPLAPAYSALMHTPFGIGPPGSFLSLTVGAWFSEGLLAFFFLLVGLEIRREMTSGALTDRKAATLPVIAAVIASIVPALIYLAINRGAAATGWSGADGDRHRFRARRPGAPGRARAAEPAGLRRGLRGGRRQSSRVLILAVFYPHNFEAAWLIAAAAGIAMMFALNRWHVYATWPYAVIAVAVWFFLHSSGVHGALAGIVLAAFLPTRPRPPPDRCSRRRLPRSQPSNMRRASTTRARTIPFSNGPSRNLSAASERLLSPADRIERAIAPWSTYLVLPLFAFSATGVGLSVDLSSPDAARILLGVILGLVVGKPLGVCASAWLATKTPYRAPAGRNGLARLHRRRLSLAASAIRCRF